MRVSTGVVADVVVCNSPIERRILVMGDSLSSEIDWGPSCADNAIGDLLLWCTKIFKDHNEAGDVEN